MVRILADSTCDLSKELTERYSIGIIPLYVRLGEDEYRDGIDITPAELYKWSDEHGQTPKTAAPGIEDISGFLDPAGSDEYVIFTISSQMSASFNNARLAAENMEMSDRVHVIDSENLSTGIGLLVIRAAELAAEGKAAAEIVAEIESLKDKVRASFVIDTLVYLHRGGRCSGLAALFGSVLKLHPRIAVTDGAMHPEQKYRGSIRKYVLEDVKDASREELESLLQLEKLQEFELGTTRKMAYSDPLTGVKNKMAYIEDIGSIEQRIKDKFLSRFGLVVFDLNDLKKMNDTYGHDAGDQYIKSACSLICHKFQHNPVYRIGGDEFVAFLTGEDFEKRDELLINFHSQIEQNLVSGEVVISYGFAEFDAKKDASYLHLYERADKKMYECKQDLKSRKR